MPSIERIKWLAVAGGAGILASKLTQAVVSSGWRNVRHHEPPKDAASQETPLAEAIAWSVLLGVSVTLVQFVARRGAAGLWRRSTGHDVPAD